MIRRPPRSTRTDTLVPYTTLFRSLFLTKRLKAALGDRYDPVAFTPPYNPWDQRLCLVPDADFFEAMKAGKASVVTDHIERFDKGGIQLKSGQHLDADIVITATGFKLAVAGKIPVRIDGDLVDWSEHYYYKACMFSNVPNFAVVFGYLNASWTLRADIVAEYVCRVLNHMQDKGAEEIGRASCREKGGQYV